jgi:PAS domain S-box-containing protein
VLIATRHPPRQTDVAALLEGIFERAPVGLAVLDREGRYLRVNERLAEINGVPISEHLGRTIEDVLPGLPTDVAEAIREVAQTGRPLIDTEIVGETPARPGVRREWLSSHWPVRDETGEVIGTAAVIIEVTERRAAERALRTQTERYETLLLALSEVGEGMVVLEDGRCVFANAAFERLSGYPFSELASMESLFDLVVPEDREEARRRARLRVERDMVDTTYRLGMRRRDGGRVELELAGVPLQVEGHRQLVVVVRDVTARRRAEDERERLLARWALLAEASALFDQSLDEERTLDSVARLCVRDLADTCVVLLATYPGPVRRAVAVARDGKLDAGIADALWEDVLEPGSRNPLPEVLRTGVGVVVDDAAVLSPALVPSAGGPPIAAAVVAPLRARGRVLGVLAAGFERLDPRDRDEILALLEDLGRRAALALDNARLYEERTAVAHTLQRSLVPPELPSIPGMQLAARYLAAGSGNEVGGDFYDCFATGGGDWAVVIGDVCGKGAEAAAITAIARYTLRAAVLHSRRPQRVLAQLNEALLRQGLDYRFCTALYASATPRPEGAEIVVATGGHPLPLVVRAGGEVEVAGSPGTLLGVVADPDITEERVLLGPGDALVLYTDGVVEASPSDEAFGDQRLIELLAGCAGLAASRIAEAIEQQALATAHGRLRDDVAVVVARVEPEDRLSPVDKG